MGLCATNFTLVDLLAKIHIDIFINKKEEWA